MMKDFTLKTYKVLLATLLDEGYTFQPFEEFLQEPAKKVVILRHDVDDRKEHSHQFARIQHEFGVRGSYYFRMVPQSFDKGVIKGIAALGHEIGYHYEDMDFAGGKAAVAIKLFEKHLHKLRELVPVTTICMHGSPRSRFDNREVWKHFDYRDFGIVGEPYFDVDFSKVFYLTDTGRRWDGSKVSVRDKVDSPFKLSFHSTNDIIGALCRNGLPDQLMLTFHPQRWTDDNFLWWKEKNIQVVKNQVKYYLIKLRSSSSPAS